MAGIALALWNLTVAPGKRYRYSPQNDIRITGAALGDELTDSSGRSTLKIYTLDPVMSDDEDDEEEDESPKTKKGSKDTADRDSCLVICSLTPGKIEQHLMDLVLLEGQVVDFHVVGKNAMYLSGNYVHQDVDQDPEGDSDDEMDSDDDGDLAFPLGEWSSDVEGSPDGLEEALGRFEEVPSDTEVPPTKSLKRPRDSDAMEGGDKTEKLSKNERKKLKKLKNENGEAVPVGSEQTKSASAEKSTSQGEKKKDKKKDDKASSEKTSLTEKRELPGGLIIQDAKIGTGPTAKKGNLLSMRYIGTLTSGKVFDSNTSGKPFKFKLGTGDVIKGWDQGIAGMQVGGERIITVPPSLAYGKRGQSGIPPNSTLVFEVKLLEVK